MNTFDQVVEYGRKLWADHDAVPSTALSPQDVADVIRELQDRQTNAMIEIESFESADSEQSPVAELQSRTDDLILHRLIGFFVQRALSQMDIACPSLAAWDRELLARRDLLADFVDVDALLAAQDLEVDDTDHTPWFLDPDSWLDLDGVSPPDLSLPTRFWESLGVAKRLLIDGDIAGEDKPHSIVMVAAAEATTATNAYEIEFYSTAAAPQDGNPEHPPLLFRHPLSDEQARVYLPRRADSQGQTQIRVWFDSAAKQTIKPLTRQGDLVWLDPGAHEPAHLQSKVVGNQISGSVRLEAFLPWQLDPLGTSSFGTESMRLFVNGKQWVSIASDDV